MFALFGRLILDYLHVSVESLTIAGGLLLLLVALQMLRGDDMAQPNTANIALVPLATPLLAGPGAIAAVMVLTRRYEDAPGMIGVLFEPSLGVHENALPSLSMTQRYDVSPGPGASSGWGSGIQRFHPSVIQLLTRVLGLLLAAIAVQFIVDAVKIIAVR